MVLLRVRSQGDALFKHTIVPWIVEPGVPLIDSVENLLPELRNATFRTADEFLQKYEFWCRGTFLDIYGTSDVLALGPGTEVFVKPRGTAPADSKLQHRLDTRSAASVIPTQPYRAQERSAAMMGTMMSEEDGGGGGSGASTAPNTLFIDFLTKHHLSQMYGAFANAGIQTLVELCCRSSVEVGRVIGDSEEGARDREVIAYRLISAAHLELQRLQVVFSWEQRLRSLYSRYNPEKVDQVPQMLAMYAGEEFDLWQALREKYEAEVAAAADIGGQHPTSAMHSSAAAGSLTTPSRAQVTPAAAGQFGETTAASSYSAGDMLQGVPPPGPVSSGQVAVCPSCRHNFTVENRKELEHIEEIDRLQREFSEERKTLSVENRELKASVDRLRTQLDDAAKLAKHYENISSEQTVWLGMVEKKLEAAEREIVNRDVAAAKGIPTEPLSASAAVKPPGTTGSSQGGGSKHDVANTNVASSAEDKMRLRKKLVEFYIRHSPDKLELVDHVISQWEGREGELERLIAIEPSLVRMGQASPMR